MLLFSLPVELLCMLQNPEFKPCESIVKLLLTPPLNRLIPPLQCCFWIQHTRAPPTVHILHQTCPQCFLFFYLFFYFILFFNFTILYWFCHISKWIRHRYTCVPHPEPSSLMPPHTIPLGRPSAPAPSIQYRASNPDWRLVSYMILYMFQCQSQASFLRRRLRERIRMRQRLRNLHLLSSPLSPQWFYCKYKHLFYGPHNSE